ncbi:MAG TPA: hypothetical protein VGR65_03965 [Casimicrobiaceae bacterium]|jgi:hypothetical protein|nr:hypothetical protein [Casimicrobiaceae bacterium]
MGKVADAIRNMPLPQQDKTKLLTLDKEFSKMETEIQTLKAENLHLQAKVNPLEREIEGLKKEKEQKAAQSHGRLDDLSEKILIEVANSSVVISDQLIQYFQISPARGARLFDTLEERSFVRAVGGSSDGTEFVATPEGRKYLERYDLL